MAKVEVLDSANKLMMLSFSEQKTPDVKVDPLYGYVKWGKKNDFPQELIRYADEHAEHGAILLAKAKYLWGKGVKVSNEDQEQQAKPYLDFANRFESWNDIGPKLSIDLEYFNSTFLQVISDLSGRPLEYFHLQYSNCRLSPCGTVLYYSEDWEAKPWQLKYKTYPLFKKGKIGSSFVRLKYYQPSSSKLKSLYPLPSYKGCLSEIKSDIDITTFDVNYVLNGFSAGTLVTFFNGEPTKEEKASIRESFKNIHSGPERAGSIVINYANKGGEAAQVTALNVDDLDKKFESIQKRYQTKILVGHNVTNPEIFGVKTEGSALGNRTSIKESHELFLNTYTKPRQDVMLAWIADAIMLKSGIKFDLEIEQLDPIGFDLSTDQDLTQDERRKLKGYEPLLAPVLDANGEPVIAESTAGNDSLKSLSRKQTTNLIKTVDDYNKGRTTKEQAMIILKGFGLSEQEAKTFLGIAEEDGLPASGPVKMSAQTTDFILAQFEAIDTSSDLELELIEETPVHFHSHNEAVEFETVLKFKKLVSTKKESSAIKDLVSGLLGKIGIGKSKDDTNTPDEPTYKTEILTKYKYALREDAPPLKPGGTSRPFCQRMLAMNKEFTFEQIDAVRVAGLSNGMPEVDNIWDYRGGFYTKPGTNDTDPFCRHYWKALTYKIKTKI